MPMSAQRPHRSKQDYATPQVFIEQAKWKIGIPSFHIDFAASAENTKAEIWISEAEDALSVDWDWSRLLDDQWGWLNPPFANIEPWARKCRETKDAGGHIAFLTPASVGSNWFRDHVHGHALVLALNGRLSFDGIAPYPKDLVLSLYGIKPGFDVWNWRV